MKNLPIKTRDQLYATSRTLITANELAALIGGTGSYWLLLADEMPDRLPVRAVPYYSRSRPDNLSWRFTVESVICYLRALEKAQKEASA